MRTIQSLLFPSLPVLYLIKSLRINIAFKSISKLHRAFFSNNTANSINFYRVAFLPVISCFFFPPIIPSAVEDPPYLAVLSSGGIPLLMNALQPPCGDSLALETIFEASWALTNLAVGDPQVVKAIVPAVPVLIMHLTGGSGFDVAEQCAWALGNIAGDDAEHRATLVANGAIPPLASLLIQGVKAAAAADPPGSISGDSPIISAAGTASWALANLLRGVGATEIGAFMATPGAAEALIDVLRVGPTRLTTEAAWVAAYVTAGPEAHLNRLVSLGIVPPLCARVVNAVDELITEIPPPMEMASGDKSIMIQDDNEDDNTILVDSKEERERIVRGVLTPLLRLLGNVAAGAGHAGVEQLLSSEAKATIRVVVVCAESFHHGLQREASWVLASIAGAPGRAGVEAIKSANALPALLSLLKNQPFHVRKEAAYALANVCAGGGGGSGDSEAANYLFGADVDAVRAMLSLMRSVDMDTAKLGLQFAEMLLRLLPSAVRQVEAADGIDAIEALQFGANAPAELQAAAAALVDRYWGADVDAEGVAMG